MCRVILSIDSGKFLTKAVGMNERDSLIEGKPIMDLINKELELIEDISLIDYVEKSVINGSIRKLIDDFVEMKKPNSYEESETRDVDKTKTKTKKKKKIIIYTQSKKIKLQIWIGRMMQIKILFQIACSMKKS